MAVPRKLTIDDLSAMKQDGEKIAMLTCYDATFAATMDQSGVDIILVGDSLGMVVQGKTSTVGVRVTDIEYHTACVAKGLNRTFLLADMPFGSFHHPKTAMKNAVRLLRAGGEMVKLEGAGPMIEVVDYLTSRGVPVCAHLGLTPQSVNQLGGFKVQARERAVNAFFVLYFLGKANQKPFGHRVGIAVAGPDARLCADAYIEFGPGRIFNIKSEAQRIAVLRGLVAGQYVL